MPIESHMDTFWILIAMNHLKNKHILETTEKTEHCNIFERILEDFYFV